MNCIYNKAQQAACAMGTRIKKVIFRSVTVYNKTLSRQRNFPAQKVHDKWFWGTPTSLLQLKFTLHDKWLWGTPTSPLQLIFNLHDKWFWGTPTSPLQLKFTLHDKWFWSTPTSPLQLKFTLHDKWDILIVFFKYWHRQHRIYFC